MIKAKPKKEERVTHAAFSCPQCGKWLYADIFSSQKNWAEHEIRIPRKEANK